jgi:hypothetical protein
VVDIFPAFFELVQWVEQGLNNCLLDFGDLAESAFIAKYQQN